MKFYIASKLENFRMVREVRDALTEMGHSITYDWTVHGPVYEHGMERIAEVAKLEFHGVQDADMVIVLWPGGRGTQVELGIALGFGIPVHFISSDCDHHHANQNMCAFYCHPLVKRYAALAPFYMAIENTHGKAAA